MQVATDSLRGRSKPSTADNGSSIANMLPSIGRTSHSKDRDEELGGKHEAWKPGSRHHRKSSSGAQWAPSSVTKTSLRWRRRRTLIILVLVVAAIYLFVRNLPDDLPIAQERLSRSTSGSYGRKVPHPPTGPPPRPGSKTTLRGAGSNKVKNGAKTTSVEEEHYYSGPIKFYRLKSTLDSITKTGGHRENNRNILFAVSSMKSASNLLPMACAMGNLGRNYVHFILVGRAKIPIDDFLDMNGVDDDENCDVYFHDGRPDYSEYSSDIRAEASVVGALNHLNGFMHPQAVIVDDEDVEDGFFAKAVKRKMKELDRPVIYIPKAKHNDFKWISRLDSASISSWYKPRIEILTHSPPHAGGGLSRLLKSLTAADLKGFRYPRLTVELPPKVDDYLNNYLRDFDWPPELDKTRADSNILKIQRRIPSGAIGSEESSVRFVESFYPANPSDDHVLILSANTEVSPLFFHYLMYTLLQTKYSAFGSAEKDRLAGIAFTTPKTSPDGSGPFKLPAIADVRGEKSPETDPDMRLPPFLWQGPQAEATLIFGDRWAEFHDYLRRRLQKLHSSSDVTKPKKILSTTQPAWLEFLLEIVRARAWTFLCPGNGNLGLWATVHTELYQPPEEFASQKSKPKSAETIEVDEDAAAETIPALPKNDPFLLAVTPVEPLATSETESIPVSQPLHELISSSSEMLDLQTVPLLSFDGKVIESSRVGDEAAVEYVKKLRQTVGGCSAQEANSPKRIAFGKAGDLFCYDGNEGAEFKDEKIDRKMLAGPEPPEDEDEADTRRPSSAEAKEVSKPKAVSGRVSAEDLAEIKDVGRKPTKSSDEEEEASRAAKVVDRSKDVEVAKEKSGGAESEAGRKTAAYNIKEEEEEEEEEEGVKSAAKVGSGLAPEGKLPHVASDIGSS